MRPLKPVQALSILVLVAVVGVLAFTLSGYAKDDKASVSQDPQAVAKPPMERNPFRQAYTTKTPSIARADLLACQELSKAKIAKPGNVDVKKFSEMLTGTWVRQLTWNGVVVENNSALFFDFRSGTPTAMMYDQSNLGEGPMTAKLEEIRDNPAMLEKTPRLTFVDCNYYIVDTYYKVSNDFLLDGLPVQPLSAAAKAPDARPLKAAWDQMVSKRFFRFEKAESKMAGEPGAEMLTPSVGGAFWQVSLKPVKMGRFTGAAIQLDGDYRGAHVGETGIGDNARFTGAQDVQFKGVERAQFFMDGDFYVSSVSPTGQTALGGAQLAGWATDCADFFALPEEIIWERVVLDPGI